MLSIITPTYNEAENIPSLAERIHEVMGGSPYELIVADDDSPDKTWEVAQKLPKKYRVVVLRRKKDKGLSQAVMAGFKKAKGDVLAVIDADLSHPPEVLTRMHKEIQNGTDLVVASRMIKGGGVEDWPWYRQTLSRLGILIARPLTPVKDIMSGYFMMKKEVLDTDNLVPRGYKILLELLVKGNFKKVKEIPYTFRNREVGESKMTLKTNLEYLQQIAHLYKVKFFGS